MRINNSKKPMSFLDPKVLHPIPNVSNCCFLKNIIRSPQIIVGDYTYYHDPIDIYNKEMCCIYMNA
jgi:virginiamycin A acetyltransferase